MKQAKCTGLAPNRREDPNAVDMFFPERGQSTNPGKIECFTCPVRPECLEYRDRTNSLEGMWGGIILSRKERTKRSAS